VKWYDAFPGEVTRLLVRALSFAVTGVEAVPVEVEADITQGLPAYTVVGLPGGAVRESGDRIRTAVRNSGFPFPGRKVTINLAPADLR
jgi:magnesium chelatase family protein